jgi:hypothetical protein
MSSKNTSSESTDNAEANRYAEHPAKDDAQKLTEACHRYQFGEV